MMTAGSPMSKGRCRLATRQFPGLRGACSEVFCGAVLESFALVGPGRRSGRACCTLDAAKIVDAALQGQPKGYLEARHMVFLADIQRMPRLIAKMFAVPAMQAYNYRVMLDRDARIAPRYPGAVDKVLWLQLDSGKLIAQHEYSSADELRQALEQVKP